MPIDISKFKNSKILVIGDFLVDEYIWGQVEGVSNEAPVPIVDVSEYNYALGGAGNVVNNLVSLGASVYTVGLAGKGYNGKLMMEKLRELGVDSRGIYIDKRRPTPKKTRVIASNQQVIRVDWDTNHPVSKTTTNELVASVQEIIPEVDIILISDHGTGTLTESFLSSVFSIAKKHSKITIIDPCGIDYNKYKGATIISSNVKEISLVTGIRLVGKNSILKAGTKLLSMTGAEGLLATCGKDGIILFGRTSKPFEIAAQARQVYDVSGASDTVLSLLGLSLAAGGSFKDAASVANVAAGLVVGKVGAATVSANELVIGLMSFSGTEQSGAEQKKRELF